MFYTRNGKIRLDSVCLVVLYAALLLVAVFCPIGGHGHPLFYHLCK